MHTVLAWSRGLKDGLPPPPEELLSSDDEDGTCGSDQDKDDDLGDEGSNKEGPPKKKVRTDSINKVWQYCFRADVFEDLL